MKFCRLSSLSVREVCLFALTGTFLFTGVSTVSAQQPQQQQQQQQTTPPAPPPPQKKQANPFETVPLSQETAPAKPQPSQAKPQLEAPKPAVEGAPPAAAGPVEDIVEAIEFRGARRVPQDTLRALIFTKKGDKFDPESLNRDFMVLWNTGRYDDITLEREPGKAGWILRFLLTERRIVRTIKYEGNKSLTISEILDRYKERKVGLQVESQYDPNKVQRARNVLLEYLSERGRQYAKVEPDIRQIPPSSLEITFKIQEGPKVKVGNIEVEGNKVFTDKAIRRAMKNLKPIGIPYSIFAEELFPKSFDSTKLEEDSDRIRVAMQQKGYFTARVVDRKVTMRDVQNRAFWRVPLVQKPKYKPGKVADLTILVDEGKLYTLNKVNFNGVKLFKTPDALMTPLFGMREGDVFATQKLQKGLESLRKLYGEFGYIDMVPEPSFEPDTNNGKMDLTLSIDEGKQFFVRRIDFSGNTTTRDKVIRRELLIDEGDMYNTRFWELSILRLNQLGYFDVLKENESVDIKRDTRNNTVDLTLKVKERGKNSVQMNGGVSGIAGSFIGFSYATNNFLGLGETLSISTQLGDRMRDVTFSFTEPYFLDKPIQVGFTVFLQRFNYDQGREVSLLSGRNLIPYYESLGSANRVNYVSNGRGATVFMQYPLKRSFARVGVSYGYTIQNIRTLSDAATALFGFSQFQQLSGPNQLNGIRTSQVIPSYTYNTVNHPITPTAGRSLFISTAFAGSALGGSVNSFEPQVDAKYFRAGFKKGHVIGMHALGRFITGYGGKVAPPFNRYYMGGENDIRGFQIWELSPMAYIPSTGTVQVYNNDGSARQQKVINSDGTTSFVNTTMTIPTYQFVQPGGDTQIVTNFEYRIPIFGPVWLAGFFDAGVNRLSRPGQLKINDTRIAELNGLFPEAAFQPQARIVKASQAIRSSTGVELQVLMPVVNAPFRLYWAYNPTIFDGVVQPPIVTDRSSFPNSVTFANAVRNFLPFAYRERRSTFRFSIGRTF
ncbi:MAG: outer membrane protein assembly factor BamA [Acidobacteria bacterium]|nr:outer membrane protein assembly factor BamA [Acidobacteriota bacterium]